MTNETENKSNKPTHKAWHVKPSAQEGAKGFWNPIGVAWPWNNGEGFNVQLDCVPVDGKFKLSLIKDKKEQPETKE